MQLKKTCRGLSSCARERKLKLSDVLRRFKTQYHTPEAFDEVQLTLTLSRMLENLTAASLRELNSCEMFQIECVQVTS